MTKFNDTSAHRDLLKLTTAQMDGVMCSSLKEFSKLLLGNSYLMIVLQRTIIAKFHMHPFNTFISAYILICTKSKIKVLFTKHQKGSTFLFQWKIQNISCFIFLSSRNEYR